MGKLNELALRNAFEISESGDTNPAGAVAETHGARATDAGAASAGSYKQGDGDTMKQEMMDEEMEAPMEKAPPAEEAEDQVEATQGGDEIGDPNVLRVVLAAMKVIYDKSTSDQVVKMLRGGDPTQALANTTLFVMRTLYEQSKKSMPVEAAVAASDTIVDLMAELAQAAGVEIEAAGIDQAKATVVQTLQQKMGQQGRTQPQQQMQMQQAQAPMAGPGLIAGAMA